MTNAGIRNVAIKLMGLPDEFIAHGDAEILREVHGLTPQNIASVGEHLIRMAAGHRSADPIRSDRGGRT
jgi:hypothetical protein